MILLVLYIFKPVPDFLRVIYPNIVIGILPGSNHYSFGDTEFYAKEIDVGGRKVYVVVQPDTGSWVRYQFFSEDGEEMSTVLSMTQPKNAEEAFEKYLSEADITGSGSKELVVQTDQFDDESSTYDILVWVEGRLEPIAYSGERGSGVQFDEIGYENGYIWTTWHDPGRTGIRWDILSANSLKMRKWFYTEPVNETLNSCYIRELNPNGGGWEILATEENCESFGTRFEKYWTPTADPRVEAAAALRYRLPVDERSLDALVGSYYDITLFYGSYGKQSIFDDVDSPYTFIEPYIGMLESWEGRVEELHKIYRMAFVLPDSPAYSYEFMYPTGPGSGGEIVGRKQIDANTVVAYASWTGAEHMGPSSYDCKEYFTNIDLFTFKKVNDEWWIWKIEEDIDGWLSGQRVANDQPCKEINGEKFEPYKTGNF